MTRKRFCSNFASKPLASNPPKIVCASFFSPSSPSFQEFSAPPHSVTYAAGEVPTWRDFRFVSVLTLNVYREIFLAQKLTGPDAGHYYALKAVPKVVILCDGHSVDHKRCERAIMERIAGRPFLGHMVYAFQTPDRLFCVMQLAQGGSLWTHMNNRFDRYDNENIGRFYMAELLVAIQHLHSVSSFRRSSASRGGKISNFWVKKFFSPKLFRIAKKRFSSVLRG